MHIEPVTWTLDGFLNHFQLVHDTMPDHQFGWIIGAGASKSSGIPTGAELAEWWLQDMHLRECKDSTIKLADWATEENLGIDDFKYDSAAAFYPRIYERRFRDFPEEGFAYLEHVMTGNSMIRSDEGLKEARPQKVIEPGPGYSILAKIMESHRHRVVITTNFDNLLADALQIYTDTYPFVCGHESLTGFVRVAMRRPVICKIHRDLLLAPLNDTRKLRLLHESWSATLRSLLGHYTPIVIGYGGNDDSLMERLNSLERDEIKGRLIWCYYRGKYGKSQPSHRIKNLVAELDGVLVPVPDFDRLMLLLGARLGITVLDEELEERQNARTERYREATLALKTDDLPQLKPALSKIYKRAGWWWWQQRIDELSDPAQKEAAFCEAVQHCPNSGELHGNFANFMMGWKSNYAEAESLYRIAIKLDPVNPFHYCNFANFMAFVKKDVDEAETLFQHALDLAPTDSTIIYSFVKFLDEVRNDHDKGEAVYHHAIQLNPTDAMLVGNLAFFMTDSRRKYEEAEKLYSQAIQLAPDNATLTGNYASLLIRLSRHDEARQLVDRSIALSDNTPSQTLAEAYLYRSVLSAPNEEPELIELRKLLQTGFRRGIWSFDGIFEMLKPKVPPLTYETLKAYGDAILDAQKAEVLDETLAQIQKEFSFSPADSDKKPRKRARKSRSKSDTPAAEPDRSA